MVEPSEERLDDVSADVESEVRDTDEAIRDVVDAILHETEDTVRSVIRYDGDEYELLYVREDLQAQFTADELTRRVETLVSKGMADPATESELFDFGELDVTVRWYGEVLVAHVPVGEWAGLVVTADRTTESLVELAEDYF